MNKKLLRVLLLMALPVLFIGQAVGQNIMKYKYVGDNQTVLYDCEAGSVLVTLGDPQEAPGANEDEVQYYWELVRSSGEAYFLNDNIRKQPITKVRIISENGLGDFVFCCSRISKYGYQKEYVTVSLKNSIEVIADPNQSCWAHGDDIEVDQFDIQTNPKGFQSHVILDLDSRKAINHYGLSHDTQEIHFVSDDPSKYPVEENTFTIKVIRESSDIGAEMPISPTVLDMVKAYKEGGTFLEKLKKVEEATKPLKKLGPFDFNYGFDGGSLGYTHGTECCKGEESMYMEFSGGISGSISFGFTYPIPPCPAIQLFVNFGAGLSLSLADIKWMYAKGCEDCDCGESKYLRFSVTGELSGGIALAAGSRDFLSISGYVTGGLEWPGKLMFPRVSLLGGAVPYFHFIEMEECDFYGKVGVQAVLLITKFTKEVKFAD